MEEGGKTKVFFEYDAEMIKRELQEVEAALEYFQKKVKEVSDEVTKLEILNMISELEGKKKRLESMLKLIEDPKMYEMLLRRRDNLKEIEQSSIIPEEVLPELLKDYNEIIGEYVDTKRKDLILKLLYKFLPYLSKNDIDECGKNVEKALRTNNAEYLSYQEAYNIIELINNILKSSLEEEQNKRFRLILRR